MALIKCPECNKEISDKSNVCIHCGCPIEHGNKNDELYKLQLLSYTEDKVKIIKILREELNLSLVDAKVMTDNLPYIIYRGSHNECDRIASKLKEVGAVVCINANGNSEVQPKDEHDPNLKQCPICGKNISKAANTCPHCGHPFVQQTSSSSGGMGFGGVVLAIIVAFFIMAFL